MAEAAKLLGCGNPILDISAEVPQAIFDKYELKPANAILAEDKHLPIFDDLKELSPEYIAGGATLNSIRVAQWMLGDKATSAYIGCIGDDEYGRTLKTDAEASGKLKTHFMISPDKATGTCAVCIKDKERSMVANLSAANEYKKEAHYDTPEIQAVVDAASVYYISGFWLTVTPPAYHAVGKHASDNKKTFCMNLSAPFIIQFFTEVLDKAISYADIVFCNETEAATFGEVKGWGSDLNEIALKISALPKENDKPRIVIFTQGSKATIVATEGKVESYEVEKLDSSLIVDTNGAGDAFVGGFLSQLVQGKDMKSCVLAGHWSARVIIQRGGCTFPEVCEYSA